MKAYLSLGSNVGDRAQHFCAVLETLSAGEPYRLSQVYETEPQGGVAQENFWNLVMEVTTDASPLELLHRARRAESERERVRTVRWGPRTLDVDVLLVGSLRSDDPEITVPHPRMWERRFVLVPLRELAPELVSDEAMTAASGDVVPLGTLSSLC